MTDLTSEDLKKHRDWLLFVSDWTQLPDAPGDQQAWASYRQQLRDLPANPNWPNVELPEPPA